MLGTKICKKELCNNYVAGKFYSNTVLETDVFTMTIIGRVEDPVIHLNGNAMRLKVYTMESYLLNQMEMFSIVKMTAAILISYRLKILN